MAINLQKGQRESIKAPKFTIGLGWDTNNTSTGSEFDLDASAFILGENKKILSDKHFIFYNNLKSPNEAVIHTGDNRTGEGEGDDEQIIVDLSKIECETSEICIVVTIHEADTRGQNFGQVRNSFIRIFSTDSGEELLKYELEEDFSIETAAVFGELYKNGAEWKFNAIGSGYQGGLAALCNNYGVEVG